MPVETWLIFLIGFMILGSIVALEMKDVLSSVVAIGVVGLAVSLAFLFLQAPDLAIVQFLFEIFALIILLRALVRREVHVLEPARANRLIVAFSLLGLAAVFFLSLKVFSLMPPFGEPLLSVSSRYLEKGASEVGAANIVAAVILDYRAYDTLGEVTVLLTAILGALTVIRSRSRGKKGGAE
jgi:multisubunit Na+/H+ antiporter MnhB subunit